MTPSPPPLKKPDAGRANARRERAWGVAVANHLALPGFGTVMAGRKIGYAQLALSVTGVLCLTVFLIYALPRLGPLWRALLSPSDDPEDALELLAQWLPWIGLAGGGIVLWMSAWFWALGTTVKEVRGGDHAENR